MQKIILVLFFIFSIVITAPLAITTIKAQSNSKQTFNAYTPVIKTPNVISITGGEVYKVDNPADLGMIIGFNHSKSYHFFKFTNSSYNTVEISDSMIAVNIGLKTPISNDTVKIDTINIPFNVDYITKMSNPFNFNHHIIKESKDTVRYTGHSVIPIVLNNTIYYNPQISFYKSLTNDTGKLFISN